MTAMKMSALLMMAMAAMLTMMTLLVVMVGEDGCQFFLYYTFPCFLILYCLAVIYCFLLLAISSHAACLSAAFFNLL